MTERRCGGEDATLFLERFNFFLGTLVVLNNPLSVPAGLGHMGARVTESAASGRGGAGYIHRFWGDEMTTAGNGEGMAARRRWRRKKDVVERAS